MDSARGTLLIRQYAIACFMVLVVSASGTTLANDIYKSTDEDGNVHYGDRPTGDETEVRLDISSRPTNSGQVQAVVEARYARAVASKEEAAAAAAAGPSEEEIQAEARERAQKCETYRARLQDFVTSRRLYKEDENGERVYLDEAQTQEARQRVEDQVHEYCNS